MGYYSPVRASCSPAAVRRLNARLGKDFDAGCLHDRAGDVHVFREQDPGIELRRHEYAHTRTRWDFERRYGRFLGWLAVKAYVVAEKARRGYEGSRYEKAARAAEIDPRWDHLLPPIEAV